MNEFTHALKFRNGFTNVTSSTLLFECACVSLETLCSAVFCASVDNVRVVLPFLISIIRHEIGVTNNVPARRELGENRWKLRPCCEINVRLLVFMFNLWKWGVYSHLLAE